MKKILKPIICIVLILNFLAITAGAYTPYINDEIVKINTIYFMETDLVTGAEKEITSVEGGKSIFAKVFVKAGEGFTNGQTATLILAAYSGEDLIISDKSASVTVTKDVAPITCPITLPTGYSDLKVIAYLWDSVDNVRPLASSAVYGSDNIKVKDIVIDGVSLSDFSNEVKAYNYKVSAAHVNFPEVSVICENSATKTEITVTGDLYSDDSYATIKITSADGTKTDSYTINYFWEKPQVTNISLNRPGYASEKLITSIVAEPEWEEGEKPESDPALIPAVLSSGEASMNSQSQGYDSKWVTNYPATATCTLQDRNWYYMDIAPELVGGTAILTRRGVEKGDDTSITNLVTFDINRSAVVYIHHENRIANQFLNNGFEYLNSRLAGLLIPDSNSSTYSYKYLYFYKKEFKVEPGETLTVSLPYSLNAGSAGKANMYGIIVKFTDDYTFDNSTLTKTAGGTEKYPVQRETYLPTYKDENASPKDVYSNLRFYFRYTYEQLNGTKHFPLLYIEEDYLGGNMLRLPIYINPQQKYSQLEFDVETSAKVKFLWNDSGTKSLISAWAEENGWTLSTTSTKQLLENNGPYDALKGGACYEKEFNVIPGEPIHVTIPLPPSNNQFYIYSIPTPLK